MAATAICRGVTTSPSAAKRSRCEPGKAVYVPVKAPHWVKNGPEVSISFSITWRSEWSFREEYARRMNALLRKAGIRPRRPSAIRTRTISSRSAIASIDKARRDSAARTGVIPELLIVVDTEEEFDWSAPFSRDAVATRSIPAQARPTRSTTASASSRPMSSTIRSRPIPPRSPFSRGLEVGGKGRDRRPSPSLGDAAAP